MVKVKFYFNDIEEVFEYEEYDDPNDEEFIWEMEDDREEWMNNLRNDETGYEIIEVVKNKKK